jgi:aminoglycoside phosphotransferase family enzyme
MQHQGSPAEEIVLNRKQRNAVYQDVLNRLSAIGDIYILIEQGEHAEARRLRAQFDEELRLLDDLGWAKDDPADSYPLTMPLAQLARVIRRLHERSSGALHTYATRELEDQRLAARDAIACSAYGEVLGRAVELAASVDAEAEEQRS